MTTVDSILNAEALLTRAQAITELHDYGDETLARRVHHLVFVLEQMRLDEAGRRAAAAVCLSLLTTRLQFFEDRKRYPLALEQISRPLFVTGQPRSGTTLLHALMSVDPNARSLRFWEVMYPSPPPGLATQDDDRRRRADDNWREILVKVPGWLISHPYNDMLGDGLPECERTWAFDFRAIRPTAWWRVPIGLISLGRPDATAQYRLHKMMLQQCQYARKDKYWILKGFHTEQLDALFKTYPDANIIWVHRDPVQVIASGISFVADLNEQLTGKACDRPRHAKLYLDRCRAAFSATLSNPMINDPRVHHVRYEDLITCPIETVRQFCGNCEVRFGKDTEAAVRAYLLRNRSDRYGKFRYDSSVIGVDIDSLDTEFAHYRARFGVGTEHR